MVSVQMSLDVGGWGRGGCFSWMGPPWGFAGGWGWGLGATRFSRGSSWEPWGHAVILLPASLSVCHHGCLCGGGLLACSQCPHSRFGSTPLLVSQRCE